MSTTDFKLLFASKTGSHLLSLKWLLNSEIATFLPLNFPTYTLSNQSELFAHDFENANSLFEATTTYLLQLCQVARFNN